MDLRTIGQLLHSLEFDTTIPKSRKAMTRTACKYAATAMGYETLDEFPVHKIPSATKVLDQHLSELQVRGNLSPNSVRNYRSFFARFIMWAEENHHIPRQLSRQLLPKWETLTFPLRGVSSGRIGWRTALRRLAFWATALDINPEDITRDHLISYIEFLKSESGIRFWHQIYHRANREWNLHAEQGTVPHLDWPVLPTSERSKYTLHLIYWPKAMQAEYERYREWCLAEFVIDRKPEYRQRPVSADQNLANMERILGFAHNICGQDTQSFSMDMFFHQELIVSYFDWLVKMRLGGKKTVTLERITAQLLGMARGFFKRQESVEWLLRLKQEVSGAPVRNKKLLIVSMEELELVANGIRELRLAELKRAKAAGRRPSPMRQAQLVMRELAFRLLMQRPLRQKNLRQIRLESNLIRDRDGTYTLSFSGPEMKNGQPLEFHFPENLIGLLEKYIRDHRPILRNEHDNPYLFPNPNGGHICDRTVQNFIKNHTRRVIGKHLYPHLFRDSVAFWILKHHPEYLLLVSKLLGHSDIKTTIRIYSNIDADDAAESLDKMFSERGLGKL